MSHRFYIIASSGYRFPPQDAEGLTDFDAMVHARRMLGPDGVIEVWRGARLVGIVGLSFSHWLDAEPSQIPVSREDHLFRST